MNESKRQDILNNIDTLIKESTPKKSKARLVGIGILNEDGSVDCKNYPHLKKYLKENKK